MTADLLISAGALLFGIIAMVLAVRRQRLLPAPSNNHEELRQQVETLRRDVASLQRMLVEKQNEIDRLNERLRQLERGVTAAEATAQDVRRKVLLVCIGTDKMLEVDSAMLRKVQAQTQIRITRLLPVSKAGLKRFIDRHRASGRPIDYVHFGVHAGPQGLVFEDGIASGLWLSQQLAGVQVVLIAGCNGDQVADLLGVVNAVVSLREEVDNHEAALFATAFWLAIGNGLEPEEAFERALAAAPGSVAEFAELHL